MKRIIIILKEVLILAQKSVLKSRISAVFVAIIGGITYLGLAMLSNVVNNICSRYSIPSLCACVALVAACTYGPSVVGRFKKITRRFDVLLTMINKEEQSLSLTESVAQSTSQQNEPNNPPEGQEQCSALETDSIEDVVNSFSEEISTAPHDVSEFFVDESEFCYE